MDNPVTFHDPGVPVAASDTVEVCSATRPSVMATVAAPIGPPALTTDPDSAP